jgi:hypothetical protein
VLWPHTKAENRAQKTEKSDIWLLTSCFVPALNHNGAGPAQDHCYDLWLPPFFNNLTSTANKNTNKFNHQGQIPPYLLIPNQPLLRQEKSLEFL